MKNSYYYIFMIIYFVLTSCSSTPNRPLWITGTLPSHISSKDCLVGIGMAVLTRDREGDVTRADTAAFSEIAKQIQVQLKEEMVSESEYTSRSNSTSGKTEDRSMDKVTIRGRQDIDFTLEGAQIVERFYDEKAKCHYSLAILHKPQTATRMAIESRELFIDSETMENEGLAMIDRGEVLPGIKKMIVSLDRYEAASKKRMVASILSNSPIDPVEMKSPLLRLQTHMNEITLECTRGNNQHAYVRTPLPKPIVVRARYGKGLIVPSLPLTISLSEKPNEQKNPVLTDENGSATISFDEIRKTGIAKNTIRIAPAWDEVIRSSLNNVKPVWMTRFKATNMLLVYYYLRTEGTTSVIVVSPEGFSLDDGSAVVSERIVLQPLIERLQVAGFIVSKVGKCRGNCTLDEQMAKYKGKSDLLIILDSDLNFSSMRGSSPLYRANLSMTCYDYFRSQIIGSVEGQSMSGASDKKRSAEKALAAVTDEYLSDFIRNIQDNLQ